MDQLLELFYSEHDKDPLDVDIQLLQAWLVVAPTSNNYTDYTVLFHKYGGANVSFKHFMSQCSMFVPTKATVKLDNGNTVHNQRIGIFLCRFTNSYIIYPWEPVYYCPGHPPNSISSDTLKFYVGFQKVTSEHH